MAKQTINLGTAPTGVGGDTPRTAFTKTQGNFDEIYTALGGTTIPAALPVNKGGTGGTTAAAARTALGLKTASTYDVIGAMGTGIMERGYNANGEYCRYANGVIEMWGTLAMPIRNLYTQSGTTVTLPTLFYDTAYSVQLTPVSSIASGSQAGVGELMANGWWITPLTNVFTVSSYAYKYGQSTDVSVGWRAIGRWQAK